MICYYYQKCRPDDFVFPWSPPPSHLEINYSNQANRPNFAWITRFDCATTSRTRAAIASMTIHFLAVVAELWTYQKSGEYERLILTEQISKYSSRDLEAFRS